VDEGGWNRGRLTAEGKGARPGSGPVDSAAGAGTVAGMATRDVLGPIAAWAVALGGLLVVLNPEVFAQAGLAVLAPLVVVAAFAGSFKAGACPQCGAGRRRQLATSGEPVAVESSRAATESGQVAVELGWAVSLPTVLTCQRCEHTWSVDEQLFVRRSAATTRAQAVLLASAHLGWEPPADSSGDSRNEGAADPGVDHTR